MHCMRLLHALDPTQLDQVLQEGLHVGEKGDYSQSNRIQETDNFLDAQCPLGLHAKGLSRSGCLYLYYAIGHQIHDIHEGRTYDIDDWLAGQTQAILAAEINISAAYISDLDSYDAVSKAITSNRKPHKQERLAKEYWRHILPLQDVTTYYQLQKKGLKRHPPAPIGMPRRLHRIEIMYTQNIDPEALVVLKR